MPFKQEPSVAAALAEACRIQSSERDMPIGTAPRERPIGAEPRERPTGAEPSQTREENQRDKTKKGPLLRTEEDKQYFVRGFIYERRMRGLPCTPVPKPPEEPPPKRFRNYYTRPDKE